MKTSTLALLLSSLLVAAVQGAAITATPGDVSWYDPIHNTTCTGHADGHISCEVGEVEAALKINNANPSPDLDLDTEPPALESRAQWQQQHMQTTTARDEATTTTCSGEGQAKALGCFINCFGQGFCTAKCDAGNVCQCSCPDGTGKGGVACSKTGCV
ncbi:hypothetical protein C8A00DRAFT_44536 [Chaetomidium leptoderma]|uniref:Uncharacterized protein n=1 Tax=Chaetomidium leptoderma TaxID=669021 RepID=A0AAN6ZW17_9PEZI|nr:hypothetical protein C8A00DRAFT_44536 [Chaetomidium leptoderma]